MEWQDIEEEEAPSVEKPLEEEVKQDKEETTEDSKTEVEEAEADFEGSDTVEDIPEGKEKEYGL